MQTIDLYQIASDVRIGRIGPGIGQQQAQMAVAALRGAASDTALPGAGSDAAMPGAASDPALPDESSDSNDESENGFSLDWRMACPYCSARTYRLTFTPVEGGLLASGECSRCHTKGISLLD